MNTLYPPPPTLPPYTAVDVVTFSASSNGNTGLVIAIALVIVFCMAIYAYVNRE